VAGPEEEWQTPAEVGGYLTTPDYAETVAYLERIAAAYPARVRIENFGETGEGRELKIVIVSKDGIFDPSAVHASGRAVLLVQNSIHAGEMDGKDACLVLLRDLLTDPRLGHLLDHVVLVFIPVYNLDGHERRSPYGRINQKGPQEFGWRANATNLNLNRDYLKADAPETRAFLRMFRRWLPDFFVDNHVTDGADFQYDVTFLLDDSPAVAPATARWIRERVTPELVRRVDASGHLAFPGPVFLRDDTDPTKGLAFYGNPPRYSTGYMILENRPGLLVELHMLKDYRTRVTGNLELLRALLEVLHRDAAQLITLNREADEAAACLGAVGVPRDPFPLRLGTSGSTVPVEFKGRQFVREPSDVSGAIRIRYGPEPWNATLPVETGDVVASVTPPAGYIVPPQWHRVLDVLDVHGVRYRRTTAAWTGTVERYRCSDMEWPARPFEGHHPILDGGGIETRLGRFGSIAMTREPSTFPARSAVVALDQRLSPVAIHWLEPAAPDSALRWGFFDPIFEQKESGEAYVVEELAQQRMAAEPSLRREFAERLSTDPAFASNADARLDFFYQRSPWGLANRVGEYPVGRLLSLDGLPL
jgi:hypothetical protein